jgi:hypothetical protein
MRIGIASIASPLSWPVVLQADVCLPGNAGQYVPGNKHPVSDLDGSSSLLRRSVSPQYCDALAASEVYSDATFQPSGCPRSHRYPT